MFKVAVLPFYPWDTDRGFSVKDYRKVDERNGTWDDMEGFVKDDDWSDVRLCSEPRQRRELG